MFLNSQSGVETFASDFNNHAWFIERVIRRMGIIFSSSTEELKNCHFLWFFIVENFKLFGNFPFLVFDQFANIRFFQFYFLCLSNFVENKRLRLDIGLVLEIRLI